MSDITVIKSTKLFYKEYPYKITYKRLYGYPPHTVITSSTFAGLLSSAEYNDWWGDIPKTEAERQRRQNCYSFLKGMEDTKFMNSSFTHVYFKTEKEFDKAKCRYSDLQVEHHVPILKNLAEIIGEFTANVDLKKSLYHKKFRYKVNIRCDAHLIDSLGLSLYDMYKDNDNYYLNPNMKRFDPLFDGKRWSHTGYAYTFRHSVYNTYSIYCKERIDMEMLTFVAGENINKITKAVLINEIDK